MGYTIWGWRGNVHVATHPVIFADGDLARAACAEIQAHCRAEGGPWDWNVQYGPAH